MLSCKLSVLSPDLSRPFSSSVLEPFSSSVVEPCISCASEPPFATSASASFFCGSRTNLSSESTFSGAEGSLSWTSVSSFIETLPKASSETTFAFSESTFSSGTFRSCCCVSLHLGSLSESATSLLSEFISNASPESDSIAGAVLSCSDALGARGSLSRTSVSSFIETLPEASSETTSAFLESTFSPSTFTSCSDGWGFGGSLCGGVALGWESATLVGAPSAACSGFFMGV